MTQPKITKKEDAMFQKEFYEGILKKNPDYVDALVLLGEIYTRQGLYQQGLKIDLKLTHLRPENPVIHYNLACSLSLIGEVSESLQAIKRAIALGYDDFEFMKTDPDLGNLRRDKRFDLFLRRIRQQKTRKKNVRIAL